VTAWGIVVTLALGLVVNEMTDISPWLARRMVRWAAYRWSKDPEIAAGYAEEWAAIIDERPGRLLKLGTAVGFAGGAAFRTMPRRLAGLRSIWRRLPRDDKFEFVKSVYSFPLAGVSVYSAWESSWWVVGVVGLVGMTIWTMSAGLLVDIVRRARAAHRP
jgi:hypothetical protein